MKIQRKPEREACGRTAGQIYIRQLMAINLFLTGSMEDQEMHGKREKGDVVSFLIYYRL
jgi:hypothetical protein